jgi:hypothetical protein
MSEIISNLDPALFTVYKDEPNKLGELGIPQNRIVEIRDFVSPETAKSIIDYVESYSEVWGDIAFYGSSGMGIRPDDPRLAEYNLPPMFFETLRKKFQEAIELVFDREVVANTSHAQKWDVGGFAAPHSDNSDFDGTPNAFEINKYVGILYLNDNYEGGELYFPDHQIEFKPSAYSYICFPGGVENIHGVREILEGTRYTMVSFWDFADAVYSDEKKAAWEEEIKEVRKAQAEQKSEWEKGNKFA